MEKQRSVVEGEFDELAGDYESNRLSQWYKAHGEEILQHVPDRIRGDILDIGCATGHLLRRLSGRCPNGTLVGIDLSEKMVAEARGKAAAAPSGRYQFYQDDWEALSTETTEALRGFNFQLIVCANAFHYFADPRMASREMYKMLGENGILLLLEREKHDSPLTALWGFLHRHFIKDQVSFYSTRELVSMLKSAGFSDVRVVRTIKKYLWKGKLFTSIALIRGAKHAAAE